MTFDPRARHLIRRDTFEDCGKPLNEYERPHQRCDQCELELWQALRRWRTHETSRTTQA